MIKKLIILSLFVSNLIYSQKVDTIIKTSIYKSYINKKLKQPVYVKYILSKGGGDCNRDKLNFKNDTKLDLLDSKNYYKSDYDKGHLANAEDFAYDCEKQKITFTYYNCIPQTHNLNAGTWKSWETKFRKISQKDSLLIVCGGIWQDDKVINGMRIPNKCFKVVYSLKTKKILYCQVYTNLDKNSSYQNITIKELKKNYKLKFDYKTF